MLASLLFSLGVSAASAQWQNHQAIVQVAQQAMETRIEQSEREISFKLTPLDRRLKLTECSDSLSAFFPSGAPLKSPTTVGVRCEGSVKWAIYLTATLSIFESVIVTKHAVATNTIITRSDVVLKRLDTSTLPVDYFTEAEQLDGYQTRRSIGAGTAIRKADVKPMHLVKKSGQVTILSRFNGISVSDQGIALSNGTRNQQIRVKNLSSNKIIKATVSETNVVRVP